MTGAETDSAMWALIVGFFLPILLALVNQPGWSARRKAIVGFIIAMLVGGITAWLAGAFEGLSLVSTILLVFVVSITTYKQFWKPTGVAPTIEGATSPSGSTDTSQAPGYRLEHGGRGFEDQDGV